MNPRGVLFDLDHTIFRGTTLNLKPALDLLVDECDAQVPFETLLHRCSRLQHDYSRSRESGFELSIGQLCQLLFSEFGLDVNIGPELERQLFDLTYEVEGLEEGLEEVLEELAVRQIPCGVLSNNIFTGRALAHGLSRYDVGHRFRAVLSSADTGLKKPHPGVFRVAGAKIGVPAAKIWFVGDSFPNDVLGAQSAGMTPVWYNRAGRPVPETLSCAIIEHWREFIDMLPSR